MLLLKIVIILGLMSTMAMILFKEGTIVSEKKPPAIFKQKSIILGSSVLIYRVLSNP